MLAVITLAACSGSDQRISEQLTQRFAAGANPIDLADLGPATWERVCVLPPYTGNAWAEHILGFPWDAERLTDIARSEGMVVLVFVRGTEVVAYAEHRRYPGDLADLQPSCLPRASAKVIRRQRDSGWVDLVPQGTT